MSEPGFFDWSERQNKLARMRPFLDDLNKIIDWEIFRITLETHIKRSNMGRPSFDLVFMFKILVLQKYHNISDEAAEIKILENLTFMRFLGIGLQDKVPDARTIWKFREELKNANILDLLFLELNKIIESYGLKAQDGQIIDATFVQTPKQRLSKEENTALKQGKTPEDWSTKKSAHKDTDAKWTKKNKQNYFGYKNHISIDVKNKIIRRFCVSAANVHDSQMMDCIIDENQDNKIWADSAYKSNGQEERLRQKGFISNIHDRAYRNRPLTCDQKEMNKVKSKIRVRVEHVFGYMHKAMNGNNIRTVGMHRAYVQITLQNICYNMGRLVTLLRGRSASIAS